MTSTERAARPRRMSRLNYHTKTARTASEKSISGSKRTSAKKKSALISFYLKLKRKA